MIIIFIINNFNNYKFQQFSINSPSSYSNRPDKIIITLVIINNISCMLTQTYSMEQSKYTAKLISRWKSKRSNYNIKYVYL